MNKGFTLVELLGVIVILAVLSTLIVVSVGGTIKKSKNQLSEVQIDNIIEAAKTYYLKEGMNVDDLNENDTQSCVSVKYLIDNGYIDNEEIVDLKDEESSKSSVLIVYENNKYKYKYQKKVCEMEITMETINDTTYPWKINNGTYNSTNKVDSSSSNLKFKFEVLNTAILSFEWSVSSESASYDYIYYTLVKNGTKLSDTGTNTKIGGTSYGSVESSLVYLTVTRQLEPGQYELIFTYSKDGSVAKGLDAGYIKNINIKTK